MIYYFSKGQAINPNEGLPYMDGLGSFGMAVRPMVEILDGSQITQNHWKDSAKTPGRVWE